MGMGVAVALVNVPGVTNVSAIGAAGAGVSFSI
jgi:hypothetical protein